MPPGGGRQSHRSPERVQSVKAAVFFNKNVTLCFVVVVRDGRRFCWLGSELRGHSDGDVPVGRPAERRGGEPGETFTLSSVEPFLLEFWSEICFGLNGSELGLGSEILGMNHSMFSWLGCCSGADQ